MSATDYDAFLAAKAPQIKPVGLARLPTISTALFPFQRDVVSWALAQGRAAIYADCGLGKTPMQLEWARHVADAVGRVLILAPLAVAQQTVREGAKFGINVTYARSGAEAPPSGVTITNYERLADFDASTFAGVVLDESGILKSYMGATKRRIVETFASHRFRLACSATPAPNDHLELGNQSDFLGVLTSHEMIARWFINDTSTFGTYRVKGHAVRDFWAWVASWARCFGKPSDLGEYSDDDYRLPELKIHQHVIDVDVIAGRGEALFRIPDLSATSIHKERRGTVAARAAKVAELVASEPGEPWVVWCETDYEADDLVAAIPGAVDVRGSQSLEAKERALLGFADGSIRVLITKPKIAGFGLNWQHCARVAFVGATYSFESFYQAIRRSYRFGQRRPVHAHVVMATTESAVWDVLTRKRDGHDEMKSAMFAAMRAAHSKSDDGAKDYQPRHDGCLPAWLFTESL